MKKFFVENKKNPWFWAFLIIIAALFFAMPLLSLNAGNSGDEDGFQWPYAEQIYTFYASGGQDTTCLQNDDMGMHGGFFDQMTYTFVKWFNIDNYSQFRHICNALFGWLGLLFAGLLAYKIIGWRAAIFTILLTFFSPRYLGNSFNNPKDLIFASTMMASIYYVVCLIKEYPKPKISTSIKLSIFAALAIVSRFAGYLLFAYLVLFLIIYHVRLNKKNSLNKGNVKTIGRYILYVVGIGIVTFGISIALWPYIMSSPIKTTMKIFTEMSQYTISLRQLFEGTLQWSDLLPWYYTPKFILMTIPIAVIVGLLLFFVFCWRKKEDRFWSFVVFFAFFFPVFWIVYTHANVYGGWRHAMFAYPPMVVAAGLGFEGLVRWVENRVQGSGLRAQGSEGEQQSATKNWKPVLVNVGAVVFLLALLIGPIRHIIANHPYEYVYFNELVGGTKNQLGQYEMDYYYHSTREASEWVLANAEKKKDGSKVIVATWHTASVDYFFRKDTNDFQVKFVRWYEKENSDWDYAIFTVTGMWPDYLKSEYFPPKNTVKTIDVDGVPIALILKREDKSDFKAYSMKQDFSKIDSTMLLYKQALKVDPNNPGALFGLGESYMRIGQMDSALFYLNKHRYYRPETSDYMRAIVYLYKKDTVTAVKLLHQLTKSNPKDVDSYACLLQVLLNQKDFVSARKEFVKIIDVDQVSEPIEKLWVKFCEMQGIKKNDAYIQLYRLMAKSLEKRGLKKEAEVYRKAIGE